MSFTIKNVLVACCEAMNFTVQADQTMDASGLEQNVYLHTCKTSQEDETTEYVKTSFVGPHFKF